MLANKPAPSWMHNLMKEMNTEIACFRLGNVHVIPVTCPSIAREFLRKNDVAFASRPITIATDIIGSGYVATIFGTNGEQWKKMKKVLTNDLFSSLKHQWLQQKMNEEADNLMFYMYNKCKSVNDDNHGLVNVRIVAQHYCGLDLDDHESKIKKAMKIMKKYHDPIIEERIKQWNDGSKEFMLAAVVDNPSNAVEWALAEMINQPELLQQAIEEFDNVVGKHRLVLESDISKLNFVKACAREALRLHPVVPFNAPHVALEDTMVANYLIPKGSHVLLSKQGLGRNPKVWNEPHKFKPERHLKNDESEVVLTEPNLRFISFSTGRRGCPRIMLGTSLTVMLLARLLHGFTWTKPPNVSSINLAESNDSLFLAQPLVALAKPRLATELYV
ncbi:hypothetical protein RIF29_04694 [Crotalaria pallida]|uniref:Cytochrome P450 n=1 Tax=Crotalaria pallida TaxID=3830 RepID=A0AAN9J1G4_CROPI